jgi:hypothetical protein
LLFSIERGSREGIVAFDIAQADLAVKLAAGDTRLEVLKIKVI